MRGAHRRHGGLHGAALAGAGLWFILFRGAVPAVSAPIPPAGLGEVRRFENARGDLVHAVTYRPERTPSQVVVLARGATQGPEEACWSLLAEELRYAGWSVIIPAPGVNPSADILDQGDRAAAAPIALGDSTGLFVAVVCAGPAVGLGPLLAGLGVQVGAVAWILPERGPVPALEEPSIAGAPRLLLVASQKLPVSLALASDLFSRFNTVAEMWLLNWGESECEVLANQRQRSGLRNWLETVAARQTGEAGAMPASGKEPGE